MSDTCNSRRQTYLREAHATVAHLSTISAHNSKSCFVPVTSYDLKQVKAVPSRPVYTVGSATSSPRAAPLTASLQVTSTTCKTPLVNPNPNYIHEQIRTWRGKHKKRNNKHTPDPWATLPLSEKSQLKVTNFAPWDSPFQSSNPTVSVYRHHVHPAMETVAQKMSLAIEKKQETRWYTTCVCNYI